MDPGSLFDDPMDPALDDDYEEEYGLESSSEEEEINRLMADLGLEDDPAYADDSAAGAAAMADMEDDADLGRRPEDDEEDLGEQSMYGGCDPREDPDCDFGGDKIKRRRPEDEKKKATVMKEDDGEYAHLGIKTTQDEYGPLHILPGVRFTGDIAADIKQCQQNDELDSWLWGELGSDESITDAAGEIVYAGADVQDYVGAEADHDGSYQPRMAEGNGQTDMDETHDYGWSDKRNTRLNETLMKWAIK